MPSVQPTPPHVEGPDASGPQVRRGGPSIPNPFLEDLPTAAATLRADLTNVDPTVRHRAARIITWAANVIERTNAYTERCRILNDRTKSSASHPKSPSPSSSSPCNSVNGVHPPGRVVNDESRSEDQLTCPHLTKETERIGLIFMPGPKTKADYESACEALLQREQRFYSESKAAQAELNVYRSERQGLITLDKREELLAGRAEKNAHRREKYDVPVFLQDLGNVLDWLPIAPKEVPDQVERDADGKPLVPLVSWNPDREGGGQPPAHQHAEVMSRTPASDRERRSSPAPNPNSPPLNSGVHPPGRAPSASGVHPPERAVNEVLSPLAARRRSAEGGPRAPYTPKRLIHPPPLTRTRPNSS